MKVVIDTNVLVSAILKDRIPGDVLLYVIEHPAVEWIGSAEIVQEYRTVLARPKFQLPAEVLDGWFAILDEAVAVIATDAAASLSRDPSDAKFLALALSVAADFLITGDRDFADARLGGVTTILSAATFKRLMIDADRGDPQ